MFSFIKNLFCKKIEEKPKFLYKIEEIDCEVNLKAIEYTITTINGEIFKTINY